MEGSPLPWSLVVDMTKNKSLEIRAQRTFPHVSDPQAQVNGDSIAVLRPKPDSRHLAASLNCWLPRAEIVSFKHAASLLSTSCLYVFYKLVQKRNFSKAWKGEKITFFPQTQSRHTMQVPFVIFHFQMVYRRRIRSSEEKLGKSFWLLREQNDWVIRSKSHKLFRVELKQQTSKHYSGVSVWCSSGMEKCNIIKVSTSHGQAGSTCASYISQFVPFGARDSHKANISEQRE